jgi:hypothetical protein
VFGSETDDWWQDDEDDGDGGDGGDVYEASGDAPSREAPRGAPTQHWPRAWAPPATSGRVSWPVATVKPLVALVTVVDVAVQRMFTRTFDVSPVRIGSHATCDLRLAGAHVARYHGEIYFEPAGVCLFFRNHAWTKATFVDDRRLARGEAVTLTEQSVIAVGRFRIDVSMCRARTRDRERARKVTPLFVSP